MSLHAVTASITLLTAIPGSGKTLRMVQMMAAHLEQGDLVFTSNINGLKLPGVMPFDDPREWQTLPAGAVLFVDEAQTFFRARSAGKVPEYISAMETIRHGGVRLVLATQQPNYLDTHLRGLVGRHEHLVRKSGAEKATIYRADMVMDNVRALAGKKGLDKFEWDFPKEHFANYTSAEVHTVKRQMPARLKAVIALLSVCALVFVGVGVTFAVGATSDVKKAEPSGPVGAPSGASPVTSAFRGGASIPALSVDDYLARQAPRVDVMPWSAPLYDDRPAVAEPALYCMIGGRGADGNGDFKHAGCSCMTEQGTPYPLTYDDCAAVATNGAPYNPFKRQLQPGNSSSTSQVDSQ